MKIEFKIRRLISLRFFYFAWIFISCLNLNAFSSEEKIQNWSVESFDANGLWLRCSTEGGKSFSTTLSINPGTIPIASLYNLDGKIILDAGTISFSSMARYRDLIISALTLDLSKSKVIQPIYKIHIVFQKKAISDDFPNPSFRPAFAAPKENAAEMAMSEWILNYAQSRNFRSQEMVPSKTSRAAGLNSGIILGLNSGLKKSTAEGPMALENSTGPSLSANLPKERLLIKTASEKIEVINFSDLEKANLPLSKIDPRKMHLYLNGNEVPILIEGENDGQWNAGDYIEFIGKRPTGTTSYNSFYAARTTFILTWEGNRLGMRAPKVPVASLTGGNIPLSVEINKMAKPFRTHIHLEEDLEILRIGSTSAEEIIDLGAKVQATELTDFWFWKRLGVEKDALEMPLKLNFTPASQNTGSNSIQQTGALSEEGALYVTINLKGITNNPGANPDHHLKFVLNGSDISLIGGINHDAIWEGQESYTWVSPSLNPSILKAGENKLVIQKVNDLKTSEGKIVEFQDAYINSIEFDFPANYAVVKDELHFSNNFSDSIGTKLFNLTGFSSRDISIWDIQGRKLSNYRIAGQGTGFQISFLDSLAGPTSYIATTMANRESPALQLDTLPDLLSPTKGADYIIITGKELFGNALDSLVDFRTKQGLRCAIVRADHIYQAFGDGSMDPQAIKRFVAYAYQNWPRPAPLFLNLVGDASLWFEKRVGAFQITTVPTHLVNIRGWGVSANDDFFTKVAGEDDISDLFVGRIPVSNTRDLSMVVRKTILSESARPKGHWHNKTLLISGYENVFAEQNSTLEAIAIANDRQISRLDLFPGSTYYKNANQRLNFYDQLDSGFTLVNFIGHGGGAVWSDAGVLTLKDLDAGKLQGEFPIPLVTSITCLTGYFEDVADRSLGEEMVRLEKGGAAGFYGSSGYISNLAGQALSSEILKITTGNSTATTGEIITQAETMVKLKTGDAFLPVLAEFNLLGDPAAHFAFPTREGDLQLAPMATAGKTEITASAKNLSIEQGDGIATIFLGDSSAFSNQLKVENKSFEKPITLDASTGSVQNGKITTHIWNEKSSRVLSSPFSSLDWLIDSVTIEPSNAASGDSVWIKIKLNTAYAKTQFNGGIASYITGGDIAPNFPLDNSRGLQSKDGIHLETVSKVALDAPVADLTNPKLYLGFNLDLSILNSEGIVTGNIKNIHSKTFAIPLVELPSLELVANAFHLPIQEKLGINVLFHNKGRGAATGFKIALKRDASSAFPVTDTVEYKSNLPFGGLDSVFFALEDSMLAGKRLSAQLISGREGDLSANNLNQDTVFQVKTMSIKSKGDSLILDSLNTKITFPDLGSDLSSDLNSDLSSKSHRFFVRTVTIKTLQNHLAPAKDVFPFTAYWIQSDGKNSFTLSTGLNGIPLAKSSATSVTNWHYSPALGESWLKLDTLSGNPEMGIGKASGLYAPLINNDVQGPIIQISSHGQVLLPDDYVPLQTPIDITIRDGQGVDLLLHPPTLTSREQSLDSNNHIAETGKNLFPTLTRLNFLPSHQKGRDSLVITAQDISGNLTKRAILYRLGDDLAIRDLGSYPNPFADTAIFVFSLTDFCEKVDLKVYSRAGRLVRTLTLANVVGYQEVVWDGRAEEEQEIANGLYFLKVTAKAGSKERSKIFKLFKKLRK